MRIVIQRVTSAGVLVSGEIVGKISKGLFVLLGVGGSDTKDDAEKLSRKLLNLRVMADKLGKMNLGLKEVNGEILLVSQFTLLADTKKGNRPSFVKAADPQKAEELYEYFIEKIKKSGVKIETGKFGAYMEIKSVLDGPVTIFIDSKGI